MFPPLVDLIFWQSIGGASSDPHVAVASRAPNSFDVLQVRMGSGQHRVWRKWWNGSAWQAWEDLGNLDPVNAFLSQAQSPAVITRGANLL